MKYCTHCGEQIDDEALICPKCGCATPKGEEVFEINKSNFSSNNNSNETLGLVAKIFMILTCVGWAAFAFLNFSVRARYGVFVGISWLISGLIPLCWVIPMTIKVHNSLKNGEKLSTAFKVCTLIFANIVSGILLLCMKEDN